MGASPTQKTMEECRKRGWVVDKAEHWNHFSKTRRDLFGFIDVVALTENGILGIQATSKSNMGARRKKIVQERPEAALSWLLSGGIIEVWGWHKPKHRWVLTTRSIKPEEIGGED